MQDGPGQCVAQTNTQRQPNAAAALRQEAVGRCDHGRLQREGREIIAGVPALLVEQERLARRRQRREQSVERVALARVRRVELPAVAPLASFRGGVIRRRGRQGARCEIAPSGHGPTFRRQRRRNSNGAASAANRPIFAQRVQDDREELGKAGALNLESSSPTREVRRRRGASSLGLGAFDSLPASGLATQKCGRGDCKHVENLSI